MLRERLVGRSYDTVADIAVCTDRRLVGSLAIETLLAADTGVPVSELMDPEPPRVSPHADQEVVAWVMLEHREASVAVVDDDGAFLGVIPPERMLRVLLQEHEEDMSRFSGLSVPLPVGSDRSRTSRLPSTGLGSRAGPPLVGVVRPCRRIETGRTIEVNARRWR